jgi:hypothetical protein
LGIPSTFVETNCYWCRDDRTTLERLTLLRRAGLHGILISVNPYYAEYVPFERTERCVRVSRRVFGRNVVVYQEDYYALFKELGIAGRISLEDFAARTGDDRSRVELFLMGRAARRLKAAYPAYPARRFFGQPCRPSFLRNWHNHIDNYGNLIPGYCGGISLGHWRDLDRLVGVGIDLTERPVLGRLIAEDVEGLLGFCRDLGYGERTEGYVSKCDLCLDLRAFLVSQGEWAELQPRAFYEHLGDAQG